jgi:putative endonuclease
MNCFVYIIRCKDGTLYTGIAYDVEKRILQHNGRIPGGAKYTRGRGPVTLVYSEKYATRKEANQREFQIKALSRSGKQELIKRYTFPHKHTIVKVMAKRTSVNTKNRTSRSRKTKKRLAIKWARKAARK